MALEEPGDFFVGGGGVDEAVGREVFDHAGGERYGVAVEGDEEAVVEGEFAGGLETLQFLARLAFAHLPEVGEADAVALAEDGVEDVGDCGCGAFGLG